MKKYLALFAAVGLSCYLFKLLDEIRQKAAARARRVSRRFSETRQKETANVCFKCRTA